MEEKISFGKCLKTLNNQQGEIKMEIWNIISSISSAISTLIALIAVIIGLRQISNLKRPKLYATLTVKQGMYAKDKNEATKPFVITGLNIEVVNLGMAKVYIDHCGVSFVDRLTKKTTSGIFAAGPEYEDFCLEPGEKKYCSIIVWDIMKDQNIGLYDKEIGVSNKAIIEINLSNGSVIKFDSKKTYAELIDEIERKQK